MAEWRKNFNPRSYLIEYYDHIGQENDRLLSFLSKAYKHIPEGAKVLDIGTGPTAYQLIAASEKVREIYCSEFLESNILELNNWLENKPNAFDWHKFTNKILELETESEQISDSEIEKREKLTRANVKKVLRIDIKKQIPDFLKGRFDVLSVQFVPESITNNRKEYLKVIRNIFSALKPGGFLILSAIKKASSYKVGDSYFPAVNVDENQLLSDLMFENFEKDSIDIQTVNAENRELQKYSGLIFVLAKKRYS